MDVVDRGWEGLTADGGIVRIRPTVAADAAPLRALCDRSSDRSLYLRFFSLNREAAGAYLAEMARPADDLRLALVAERAGRVVAVAGWDRTGPAEAEVALLVEDDRQGEGIGTLLVEELAARARRAGIKRLVADVLGDNHRMITVFGSSGLRTRQQVQAGVVHVEIDTAVDDDLLRLVDSREASAEVASLQPLLSPRSVVVIGASRHRRGVGYDVLTSILDGGFTGSVHVVNPSRSEIAGCPSYARVTDVPATMDLAVVAVPAPHVPEVLDDCGRAGVRAAVVLTSGMGESGGETLQEQALTVARTYGMRLVGPNCLGLVNTDPQIRLDAWFGAKAPAAGRLAVATQSGAVGIALADLAGRNGLGIAYLVSLGNKVDVSGNDLLLRWWRDTRVGVIGLYLESLGNPRKFARLARRVGVHKPVLVVKGGRSDGGRRAGQSHTAAAASADTTIDALFAQAGVLRMDTVEELVDVARLLDWQPVPSGGRLAVVGNGGGLGVLAADAAAAAGLEVPPFSTTLLRSLGGVGTDNPVDLGADADPERLAAVAELVATSGEVDVLLVAVVSTRANAATEMLRALGTADLSGLTVVVTLLGSAERVMSVPLRRGDRAPVYAFPESAVRAVGHAVRHGRWRRTPPGTLPSLSGIRRETARGIVATQLAASPGGAWLPAQLASQLLSCYGVAVLPVRRAGSADEAVRAAESLGLPVVLKTDRPDVVHKTDVGGVRVGLTDTTMVAAAFDDVVSRLGGGALVQREVPSGVDLVVGVVREETFGPVAMVGLGGVYTDLLADRSFRLLPITDRDATEVLLSLRAAPLLRGYRGAPAVDVSAVEQLLLRVSALAQDVPELAELDLNPVIVSPTGAVVVDAKLRLAAPEVTPDDVARALRH
ncbi:MAG TPA: GNAT family N-acetyltransferase [Actinomycetes bacterium]|nr:GNAT family N-acetyltransferase [Actinomycetes bacterium]